MGEMRRRRTDQEPPAPAEIGRGLATNILESITDGFIALDHEWRFRYINASAELFFEPPLPKTTRRGSIGKRLIHDWPDGSRPLPSTGLWHHLLRRHWGR